LILLKGTRYLLTDDIGDSDNTDPSESWGSLVAKTNDIIEYNGTSWTVSFNSDTTDTEYVTNATTDVQYVWTGSNWIKSYQGIYRGGDWSLVL
jgi:CRISPR/Cas system CMR-associated protein Cmr5 small subunit